MRILLSVVTQFPALVALLVLVSGASRVGAQSSPPPSEARAAYDRGHERLFANDPLGARPHYQQAFEAASRANDLELAQRALFRLADVHADLGDWPAMLDYSRRAYETRPDPKGTQYARHLSNRGRAMMELRERDQALAAYTEGLALAQQVKNDDQVAQLQSELGLLYWRFDRDRDRALEHYRASLAYDLGKTTQSAYGNAAAVLNNIGNIYRGTDHAEAERIYKQGLALSQKAGGEDAFLLKNLGIVYRDTGRLAEARQTLERALALADRTGTGRIRWQARMELGTLHAATDPVRAAAYYEDTLRNLEAQYSNVLLEGFRAGGLSGAITIYDDPYDLYTDLLLRNGRERDAFLIAERARARSFLDTLSLARTEIAQSLPEAFVTEERALLATINRSQAALRDPSVEKSQRDALQEESRQAEEHLAALRVRLAVEHPALAHARYPKIWSVEDVQSQLLQPGEVLLQYYIGAQASTLWAITATGVHVRRLPARAEVETAVRAFIELLSRPDTDVTAASKTLGRMLLPDLDQVLPAATRVIVVPHGIVTYVPFEALISSRDRYLVLDHSISYAPSTSSLGFLRSRQASGVELVALGNAVMRAGGAAEERGQSLARVGSLKPLLHSGPEVRAVGGIYGQTAHVFEQQAATELVLASPEAARAGIIHIATHGVIDEDVPERSGLALTAAPPSDGILQMREVYNLHLNAALVTLSACQTALGKSITGEGMVGLSRAFFYAGSNAVLASLWNVNDASTERLMRPFYESLSGGAAIDEALRQAKLELVNAGGRLAHPYYWAPFVVTGHGTATVPVRPAARFSSTMIWSSGLVFALLMMAGAFAWRRVR